MRLLRRRPDSDDHWQPRLWVVLVGLVLLVLYVIGFVVQNDKQIKIDFVLLSAKVSLIWVIVLIFAIGLLSGVLLSQVYRRRRRQQRRDPGDRVG